MWDITENLMLDVHCECPGCGAQVSYNVFDLSYFLFLFLLFSYFFFFLSCTHWFLETDFVDRFLVMIHIHTLSMIILTDQTCWFRERKPTQVTSLLRRTFDYSASSFASTACVPSSACLTLDTEDCSPPDPSVPGILNAQWWCIWAKWTKWLCVSPEWQQAHF